MAKLVRLRQNSAEKKRVSFQNLKKGGVIHNIKEEKFSPLQSNQNEIKNWLKITLV